MFYQLRHGMVIGQQDIGKAFVVAQQNIVARPKFFNQICFQQQRVGFGFGADKLHIPRRLNHTQNTIIVTRRARIGPHARFQIFGLADIEHRALAIQHAIDAWACWQRRHFFLN